MRARSGAQRARSAKSSTKRPSRSSGETGGASRNYARHWEEPAACQGPWGERHCVRVGPDGRVCYFGESDMPGEWTLETLPFDGAAALGICTTPDGTPFVGCIDGDGNVHVAMREDADAWSVECVGRNALGEAGIALSARDDQTIALAFQCWNPATEEVELKLVDFGLKYCRSTLTAPRAGPSGDFMRAALSAKPARPRG